MLKFLITIANFIVEGYILPEAVVIKWMFKQIIYPLAYKLILFFVYITIVVFSSKLFPKYHALAHILLQLFNFV